ncbi:MULTISPECIES: hypothetical protein [Streptomyces]|uniref:Uncharacterized protein n=1 Tax=Streptomyces galilaeus TaxID=33899 RepID=A0ABW9IQU5_STRGJ
MATFALAWPLFTQAWNDMPAAEQAEDSNYADPEPVVLSAIGALPAVLLIAGLVAAVLQAVCAVCVTTAEGGPAMGARRLWRRTRAQFGPVAALYVLRGTLVVYVPRAGSQLHRVADDAGACTVPRGPPTHPRERRLAGLPDPEDNRGPVLSRRRTTAATSPPSTQLGVPLLQSFDLRGTRVDDLAVVLQPAP